MKQLKEKRLIPGKAVTALLFILAAGLLLFSGIGTARAALAYYSENYTARLSMKHIGVTLIENGSDVSWRDYISEGSWSEQTGVLLAHMLDEDQTLKLGKAYAEAISVRNSGDISQYVRVTLCRYWVDGDGNKLQNVSPELIELNLINQDAWLLDSASSTAERTVLYYHSILAPGETTLPLSDQLVISSMTATKVTQEVTYEGDYTIIHTIYDYNGLRFVLQAEVDAVQDHNAEAAILSSWGKHVNVSGGSLSLGN